MRRPLQCDGKLLSPDKRRCAAPGPAHTHRIPRPVLTPCQGSSQTPSPQSGVLVSALRLAGGGGVLRRPADGFPSFLPPPPPAAVSPALSRSALRARDALVLEHLPLADALASAAAGRLFPPVEREDLIQVAIEALVRCAPHCRAGEPAGPYLRRCIAGAHQCPHRNSIGLRNYI